MSYKSKNKGIIIDEAITDVINKVWKNEIPETMYGSKIIIEPFDPDSEAGRIDDLFISTTTWNVFIKNAGETWTYKGNIKGEIGKTGPNGTNLEFEWDGTKLGIRSQGEDSYQYVDLQGKEGKTGETGAQGETGKPPETLLGENEPTISTVGISGQFYFTSDNRIFINKKDTAPYTWAEIPTKAYIDNLIGSILGGEF